MKRITTLIFTCMFACLITSAWSIEYEICDLGVIDDFVNIYADSVNNRGEVVGRAYNSNNTAVRAFAWDSVNGIRFIGDLGSEAFEINNNGIATVRRIDGWSLWDSVNGLQDMEPNIGGFCINDLGQLAYLSNMWDPINGVTPIPLLPGFDSNYASAINNNSQVIGNANAQYPFVRGFIWDSINGTRNIGCLSGYYSSYALGVNDLGQIVGDCRDSTQSTRRAYIWDSVNGIQDLGISGGASDINNAGQIVGNNSSGATFVMDSMRNITYLPTLVSGKNARAIAISEDGLIVGRSLTADNKWHAVMWTPVPEPSSMIALGVGLLPLAGVALKRRRER